MMRKENETETWSVKKKKVIEMRRVRKRSREGSRETEQNGSDHTHTEIGTI